MAKAKTTAGVKIRARELTTIDEYLRTGKSNHTHEGGAIVRDIENDPFLLKDGEFLDLTTGGASGDTDDEAIVVTDKKLSRAATNHLKAEAHDGHRVAVPAGVIIPGAKGWKHGLLIAGDDGQSVLCVAENTPAVTISFLCLARFIDGIKPLGLVLMLHSGKIKVLDSTEDQDRKVSAADQKKFKASEPVSPPEPGFTYLNFDTPIWHRAATVLFRYGRTRILLGQDDDAYFGCELKGTPNTVKEAFVSLVPEHIRKVRGVSRQGEWFVVPVAAKNVPAITECAALVNGARSQVDLDDDDYSAQGTVDLPVDDKDSARHTVHSSDIRIGMDGRLYAFEGLLAHSESDHPIVSMKKSSQWHTFDHNTAVRSFSQQGVD